MSATSLETARRAIRTHVRATAAFVLLAGGTAAASGLLASLDGAVVTGGSIVVESSVKKVQHASGGIIGELNVREGQRVAAGDVLARLDDTVTRANLGVILNELTALQARRARLVAEQAGTPAAAFPQALAARAEREPDIARLLAGERQLMGSRLAARAGQKAQLAERIVQAQQELQALKEQHRSVAQQLKIARDELDGLRGLEQKRLVPRARITALEREVARGDGQLGEIGARLSQTSGRIAEAELQALQVDKDAASDIAKDLREAETRIGELTERRAAAEDQLKRIDIRAPIAGLVHQLAVHTVGGVVMPSEPLMLIVPEADRLIVEVRIAPQDIDQIRVGQAARVRFTAFNARVETPEAAGRLTRISGDITREKETGLAYYTGGIALEASEVERLRARGMQLVPGMPAEAFITTGARTLASYLLKPATDQMHRALRER